MIRAEVMLGQIALKRFRNFFGSCHRAFQAGELGLPKYYGAIRYPELREVILETEEVLRNKGDAFRF